MINDYVSLSTRDGFNKSLRHLRMVTGLLRDLGKQANLSDLVNEMERSHGLGKSQIGPILNAVIVDRMRYSTYSFHLSQPSTDLAAAGRTVSPWNKIDFVLAYHDPQLGITLVNPKRMGERQEAPQEFAANELIVLYAKAIDLKNAPLESPALQDLHSLLCGKEAQNVSRYVDSTKASMGPIGQSVPARTASKPAPAKATQRPSAAPLSSAAKPSAGTVKQLESAKPGGAPAMSGPQKMTPKYSVVVTNELFHNGNVEAWKNIVESYQSKYTGLKVHIFHEGQQVHNINALFKWGKVKHGDVLLISISGSEIKGVAKLQRYLFEGASLRYENFLKKDVNKVMNLF